MQGANAPGWAVFRVGKRPDDIYYENSIKRHCEQVGVRCQTMNLPPTIREDEFAAILMQAVQDHTIHGIFFIISIGKFIKHKIFFLP